MLAASVARADGHPDFSGTWRLDLDASDLPEDMMKAQGLSWLERRMARSAKVTQRIVQEPERLLLHIDNPLGARDETLPIGGAWEEKERKRAGQVRTRTYWSPGGEALVTESELHLKDGTPARLLLSRTLADQGQTLVQSFELRCQDGRRFTARRVFRRDGAAPPAR